ncbi:FitA-like ribbon-helix-helix domain-containing protein [Endothiovibrio diazotrophicus]
MMSTLQIRNLPEDVYQALSLRAEREHRSLAQQAIVELRKIPELESRARRLRTLEKIRGEIEEVGARGPSRSPEELIREDRER